MPDDDGDRESFISLQSAAIDGSDADNILFVSPPSHEKQWRGCAELLKFSDPADATLIGVTFTHEPGQLVSHYEESLPSLPSDVWIIAVGEETQSAANPSRSTITVSDVSATVSTVDHPQNLTDLGVALTECFEEAAPRADATEARMDFRSVSALLQHADIGTVYKFLDVLTGHVSVHGITAHYHLDPLAHDEQTINQLRLLCDAVAELPDD